MTPAARVQAAIECVERWQTGEPVGRVLVNWARGNRYAGSGDRAAVRDLVYSAIRRVRSSAWLGGGDSARLILAGLLRSQGESPGDFFTGERHAPARLSQDEGGAASLEAAPRGVRLDCPDWLLGECDRSLDRPDEVLQTLRQRAPVFLRVNTLRASREEALARLAEEGIRAEPNALAPTALEVREGARRVQTSRAFAAGLVELQDAASQAVIEVLAPVAPTDRVLDYCAGGGGKALALAALSRGRVDAHDAEPARMADLPDRARRAGADIRSLPASRPQGPYDLVLCDAPCSGSGAWRRQPEAKWRLTPERLGELTAIQDGILTEAARLIVPGGRLAYVTCSVLAVENEDRVRAFLSRHPDWQAEGGRRFTPSSDGDGFFLAIFRRPAPS